ncbi:MAG TPA: AbrB/MazE/SpoVT family DNA-binding domain-containing protein [Thermomicrobiaceae bacterium]|nr:AbrB/MazE/SpoVT family DNA-binding domain-containing protein [Thermomicrobiaceae bacterium]
MPHTVGSKGQVVIEKAIRDRLGVEPGWLALQVLVDDHVEIRFVPPEHDRSLAGVLAGHSRVRVPDADSLREARERVWDERAHERAAGWDERPST